MPNIFTVHAKKTTSNFEQYAIFLRWQEAASFVVLHFWNDRLINVVLSKETRFLYNKVYRRELLQIVAALSDIYDNNEGFNASIELYNCIVYRAEIEETYRKLIIMKDQLRMLEN